MDDEVVTLTVGEKYFGECQGCGGLVRILVLPRGEIEIQVCERCIDERYQDGFEDGRHGD